MALFLDAIHTELLDSGVSYFLNDSSCGDVDALLKSFASSYRLALGAHAPFRTFCVSRPEALWFTKELEVRVRERDRLLKQASRAGNVQSYAIYRELGDELTRDIRGARTSY